MYLIFPLENPKNKTIIKQKQKKGIDIFSSTMSDNNESGGETASNHLEKIKPKDLIMFSPKTRQIIAKVCAF